MDKPNDIRYNINLRCLECGVVCQDYLGDHLVEVHEMTGTEYLVKYPDAPILSERLKEKAHRKSPRRGHPPAPESLTVNIAGIPYNINPGVPESACLPLPSAYRFPGRGELAKDIRHAAISILKRRSTFVWGLPGSGKDAFFHAISAKARIPGIIRSIKPGIDISSWFYSRSFDANGTTWETGEMFEALTKGYEIKDASGNVIKRVPYLVLITDFDRADRAQAEHLRLIMDSIQGRVEGPQGLTHDVLPGTVICCTGNSAGEGDNRNRCISSNVIDASILDRFNRVYEFHWMVWGDEEPIVREKFPLLVARCPEIFATMGKITTALRKEIANNRLFAEFSHRALCSILEHAQDMIEVNPPNAKIPTDILKGAARAWLDRLADPITKMAAQKTMDPYILGGMIDEGEGNKDSNFEW